MQQSPPTPTWRVGGNHGFFSGFDRGLDVVGLSGVGLNGLNGVGVGYVGIQRFGGIGFPSG